MTSSTLPVVLVITQTVTSAFLVRSRLEPAGLSCVQVQDGLEAEQHATWLQNTGEPLQAIIALDPPAELNFVALRRVAPSPAATPTPERWSKPGSNGVPISSKMMPAFR